MKKRKALWIAIGLLAAFVLWTASVCWIDVQAIGPGGSMVGFATVNRFVHSVTGVHMLLYTLTDWLGLVPIAVAMGFGLFGLGQWIKRKSLLCVDYSIRVLGGFYIVVMAAYLFFESFVINYRPVLINGYLEASYPSSTTLLVLCVMPTSIMQLRARMKNGVFKKCVIWIISLFTAFMAIGRLVSGVHWFTDIFGGALLSAGLVVMYHFICGLKIEKH